MHAFISHISEEAAEARALKLALEQALVGAEVFVSASDIHLGDAWLKEVDGAMRHAKAVIALCSPSSLRRPWLNFESGAGWARRRPVVPVCIRGLRKDQLPDPMGIFQGLELSDADALRSLAERLSHVLGTGVNPHFDADTAFSAQTIVRPARGEDIGIVLTHRQSEWEASGAAIFTLANRLPAGLAGSWKISNTRGSPTHASNATTSGSAAS